MPRNISSVWPLWILLAAFVFVFGYFGIDKFVTPVLWMGFLPAWMDGLLGMPKETWIAVVGAAEIVMAVMLLIPHSLVRRIGAGLIILHLITVVIQVGWNDIGVRDIGLLLSAAAMYLLIPTPASSRL
jgi:hypothetical protein